MTRLARVIAVGVPHHITQRGNVCRFILQDEADRNVELDLLRQSAEQHGVALIGHCLISKHVLLVAVPRNADASQHRTWAGRELPTGWQLMPLGDR